MWILHILVLHKKREEWHGLSNLMLSTKKDPRGVNGQ